jgi:hypothetical protein
MPEPFADTLATVAAGRTALVARFQAVAAPFAWPAASTLTPAQP